MPENGEPQQIGTYTILAKLGQGGMGAVYKANDPALDRTIAVKVLPGHLAGDADFTSRFKREAMAAAKLNHPNVVQVYAAGEDGGTHFIAMEFVDGETLFKRLRRVGHLDIDEALAITLYVADALRYAWNKAQIIHRDIKPDNVLLSTDGEVKLTDLGLAKSLRAASVSVTSTGTIMGSAQYISPEQARGEKNVDFRTDIYSLGCTLFHMLTGRPPYEGEETMALLYKHVNEPPPDPTTLRPDCPPCVAALVLKMMSKDRAQRPATYDDLICELTALHAEATGIAAAPAPAPTVKPATAAIVPTVVDTPTMASAPAKKRKPVLLYAGAATLVVAAVIGLLLWSPWKGEKKVGGASAPRPTASQQPGREQWVDGLAEWWAKPENAKSGVLVKEAGGSRMLNPRASVRIAQGRDIAIRATVTGTKGVSWFLTLRSGKEGNNYSARLTEPGKPSTINLFLNGQLKVLQQFSVPHGFRFDQSHTMEFRAQGDVLTVMLDGTEMARVQDDTLPDAGVANIGAGPGTLFEKLEYRDLSATQRGVDVAFVKEVAALSAEQQVKRVMERLEKLNPGFLPTGSPVIVNGQVIELRIWPHVVKDLSPVRALAHLRRFYANGSTKGGAQGSLSDLTPLKGMPLETLGVYNTLVSDLTPLQGMRLRALYCGATRVADLSPLRHMMLQTLACDQTEVTDLSPLQGMGRSLKTLLCEPDIAARAQNREILRGLKSLETINDLPVAEFWKQVDAGKMPRARLATGETAEEVGSAAGDAFIREVAALPAEQQVKRVVAKLKELNPGLGDTEQHKIEDGKVTELQFQSTALVDLSPIRALTQLHTLGCSGYRLPNGEWAQSQLRNLSPLRGLQLQRLWCSDSSVSDLSPLTGMPLRELVCQHTEVADLAPLAGMPLRNLRADLKLLANEASKTVLKSISTLRTINDQSVAEFWKQVDAGKTPGVSPPADDAFVKEVAALPAEQQVKRVVAELTRLNPGYDGKETHKIENGQVRTLTLAPSPIVDISPVRALVNLNEFCCGASKVRDLSPLHGLPLTVFFCGGSLVSDLSPLRGMKLIRLHSESTKVTDLSPLQGMPLGTLFITKTPVNDLSPLRSVPLRSIRCDFKPERDAEILRSIKTLESINGMPAAEFWKQVDTGKTPGAAAAGGVTGWIPLDISAGCNANVIRTGRERLTQAFGISGRTWATTERLRSKGFDRTGLPDDGQIAIPNTTPDGFFQLHVADGNDSILVSIRGETPNAGRIPTNATLTVAANQQRKFSQLAFLHASAPCDAEVSVTIRYDTGPDGAGILHARSWSPEFHRRREPLAANQSVAVRTSDGSAAADAVEMIAEMLPLDPQRALKSLTFTFGRLSPKCEYPLAIEKCLAGIFAISALPVSTSATDWSNAINLLPLIDPQKDAAGGKWTWSGNTLVSDSAQNGRIAIPYQPPQEYDYRLVFHHTKGYTPTDAGQVIQILSKDGRLFSWIMGAKKGEFMGFETVAGANSADGANPTITQRKPALKKNVTYTSLVEVRNDGLKAYLNGEMLAQYKTDYKDMGIVPHWKLPDPTLLGVGSWLTAMVIEKLELREVTGKGVFTRPNDLAAKAAEETRTRRLSSESVEPRKAGPWNVYTGWPFDTTEAKRRQEETAKVLGVPVEQDVDLGGGVRIRVVLVPAGEFMMGSDKGEAGEKPVHKVTIARPFYLGKYEVTQEQWQAVMGSNPSIAKNPKNPVEMVSWDDCQSFLTKLKDRVRGFRFILPTETQWEYACRAGCPDDYCCGNGEEQISEYAWHKGNSNGRPHPVGEKKSNAWGLCDMHGNNLEWCQDFNHPNYEGAPNDGGAWVKDGSPRHILRGGSWYFPAANCRSAARTASWSDNRYNSYGLRLVMAVDTDLLSSAALAATVTSHASQVTVATDAFLKEVAALPAEKKVQRVMAKLKELNPGFDGKESHKIQNGVVTELAISTVGVTDITPLKALKWLTKLSIAPTVANQKGALSDLTPLRNLPLTGLWCQDNPINDLTPLKGLPLTVLSAGGTQVRDLTPLAGMKLTLLSFNDTTVADIAPLDGMPLTVLWCHNTKVTDLSPLKAAPLQELQCDPSVAAQNIAVLRGIKTLGKINHLTAPAFFTTTAPTKPSVAPSVGGASAPRPSPPPTADQLKKLTVELGGDVKMEFILIPAGSFRMGSDKSALSAKPVHKVTITKPFYLGKYEVTQAQWEAVMGGNPSDFKGARNPVIRVSWEECQTFLQKLQEKVPGQMFRLPTEAEWEYACRAGGTADYFYGNNASSLGDYAWYNSNSDEKLHPVGEKKPNAWGLHDMPGNVWEWCADWYEVFNSRAATDPVGPSTGPGRVMRGGSWMDASTLCRSGERGYCEPPARCKHIGLRVVAVVP